MRTATYLANVRGELVKLCDYHSAQMMELFPSGHSASGIFLKRERSRTDWHDRVYHEGVPDHILKARQDGHETSKRYF